MVESDGIQPSAFEEFLLSERMEPVWDAIFAWENHPVITAAISGALGGLFFGKLDAAVDRRLNPQLVEAEAANFKFSHLLTKRHAAAALAERHPMAHTLLSMT